MKEFYFREMNLQSSTHIEKNTKEIKFLDISTSYMYELNLLQVRKVFFFFFPRENLNLVLNTKPLAFRASVQTITPFRLKLKIFFFLFKALSNNSTLVTWQLDCHLQERQATYSYFICIILDYNMYYLHFTLQEPC